MRECEIVDGPDAVALMLTVFSPSYDTKVTFDLKPSPFRDRQITCRIASVSRTLLSGVFLLEGILILGPKGPAYKLREHYDTTKKTGKIRFKRSP